MVKTVSTVECVICHTTHLETPRVREDGEYNAKDWTYYRDNYEGTYSVLCKKTHDDLISPKSMKVES